MKSINTEAFFKEIYSLIHPLLYQESFYGLMIILTLLNKVQELDIINNLEQQANPELKIFAQLIRYCFVITILTVDQLVLVMLAFFTIHIIFILLFFYFRISKSISTLIHTILHFFLLYYTLIFYIPIIYASLYFVSSLEICDQSELCTESNKIGLVIISIFNLIMSLGINTMHMYFGRADSLLGDNHILVLNYSFINNLVIQICLFTSIVLKTLDILQLLRFALICVKFLINTLYSINKINVKNFVLIDCIALTSSIAILIQLSFFEFLIVISLVYASIIQIQDIIETYYVTIRDQNNLITLQIIEEANRLETKTQSRMKLKIMERIHFCKKCKYSTQIVECILRRMANKERQQDNYIVNLFCEYVSNHAPLKALIRLLLIKPDDLYYRCWQHNLAEELNRRSTQFQKEADNRISMKNTNEHQNSLDVQTVYLTSHSASELFPHIQETIQSKIGFWNKLINGYQDIDTCLEEALKTSSKMLRCKQFIEQRFDLTMNKLKNQQGTDILSLRIIQIYYCGIYTNQFQAYSIEKTIDDLLKSERFKQDESLDNIQLVQDRLIILKSSFVSKRGELIDLNYKQLSKFLNESEENVKMIKHCSQLMPSFLSFIHDSLMDNYNQQGYSKLMIHGESSFFQNLQGFIEPCSINLFNFYDGSDDFVLNMILTKEQTNSETILFGIDGKILGITSQFFEEAIKQNMQQIKTYSTGVTKMNEQISIQEFLSKSPLIQFYIPNISAQIEELKNQICQSSNFLMNNQKSTWSIPSNHNECFQQASLILSQFKKRSQGTQKQNYQSYKSQTYSKYSNQTLNTQHDQYDRSEIEKDILNQISVDNIPIIILHPDLLSSLKEVLNFDESQKSQVQLGIFYSLQYKVLKQKSASFGYFMLTMKEYKFYYNQTQQHASTMGQTPQTIRSCNESLEVETKQNSFRIEITTDNLNQQEELIQEIRFMNGQIFNQDGSIDQSSAKIKNSDRSNLYDSSRIIKQNQPLFAKPKLFENRLEDISQIEQDMQNLQQIQNDFDENDQELINQKQESLSQSVKKRSNVLDKIKQSQLKKEKAGDFMSNPSRSSTNSTSKESILIVQQLYYNTNLISPLKKISCILGIILIGILVCDIVNVFLVKDNLESQTQQVINLVKPQNIIYYYTSVFYQFWGTQLDVLNIVKLSDFLYQRNLETLDGMMTYGREYLQDFGIEVPLTGASLGYETFDVKLVELNQIQKVPYQLQNFYSMLYELTIDSYLSNLKKEQPNYDQLFTKGTIRQNFLQLIDLHNQLVIKISEDTIKQQNQVKSYFLIVMLLELFSVLLFVGFQLRYWLFLDHITKSIIFLVSRLNETQAIQQVIKLQQMKDLLDDHTSNIWKLYNFGDLIFEFSDKKTKKQVLKQQDQVASNYKSTSALYSRIQRTYYLNRVNVILTFLITLLWTAFLLAGYLIHMQKNDNFQPSLTATLKYGQFRLNMDSVGFIAGMVKTELLIPNASAEYINQTYAISLLIDYKENLSPLINEVAQVILENANANNKKSRFDDILNYDICEFTPWEQMKSCDVSRQSLPYSYKDSINDIVKNGVLGYTAALVKYLNSDYDYELNNMKYDTNENNLISIQSKPFENFWLSYYCDIQNTMLEFLNLFQIDNSEIAADINSVIQIFYLGIGICLFLFLLCMNIAWVYKSQKKISCLRQILVLLPPDLILTANIRSQAKEIHNWLY